MYLPASLKHTEIKDRGVSHHPFCVPCIGSKGTEKSLALNLQIFIVDSVTLEKYFEKVTGVIETQTIPNFH